MLHHVGETLTITNAVFRKQGYYICRGRNETGHVFHARAHLIVRGKLRVFMFN